MAATLFRNARNFSIISIESLLVYLFYFHFTVEFYLFYYSKLLVHVAVKFENSWPSIANWEQLIQHHFDKMAFSLFI